MSEPDANPAPNRATPLQGDAPAPDSGKSPVSRFFGAILSWFDKPTSFSNILLSIAKLGGILIFLPIVSILIWDQATIWWGGQSPHQLEEREFLCTQFVLPENIPEPDDTLPPELLQIQRSLLHVSLMKEKARSYIQPIGAIDRIASYLKCTSISGVSASSITIEHTLKPDLLRHLDLRTRIDIERQEFDYFAGEEGIFSRQIPARIIRLWSDSIDLADSALGEREKVAAAVEPPELKAVPAGTTENIVEVPGASWVLIAGGDKSLDAAVSQVGITKRVLANRSLSGAGNVALMSVSGWYRTVIPFQTRAAAQNALNTLISALPYGGYLRDIPRWCGGRDSTDITAGQSAAHQETLTAAEVKLWSC